MIKEYLDKYTGKLKPYIPCPQAADRKAWESLDAGLIKNLITCGEAYLGFEWPPLYATDYMDFTRTGNREHFQAKQFLRRTALNALVLAECAEHEGRFLDDIINGIFLICEETAWQLPAHNSYIRDTPQAILPDASRPIIDLFAAETGAVLAMAEYVLRDELHAVSPSISVLVNQKLTERILLPYMTEHFWWMGDGESHMNNWTVWCTQNVLFTALTRESLPAAVKKEDLVSKAAGSIDYFLAEYGDDGCCDEGAQYYRHAGLCLFACLEVLNAVTDQALAGAWKEEKVKNIASYILNAHIDGPYYVNFADCSPIAGRCNAREYLFGKRTGNEDLMAFAAADYQHSECPLLFDEHNLYYRLLTVFTHGEMSSCDTSRPIPHKDIYYPSVGLFAARDQSLYLAVKAGDNDDSHNHNDTGSFTIYKDGKPLFIDAGVETYTKKTFSPDRYQIWTMQSQYHNLPTFFDGDTAVMQKDGADYRAEHVIHELGDHICKISMDIAKAYPDGRITSYRREAVLEKGTGITIEDHYEGTLPPPVLSLMTYEKPVYADGILSVGDLGNVTVEGAASVTIETVPVTDERLKTAWKHDLYRCLVTMEKDIIRLTIPERLRQESDDNRAGILPEEKR